MEIADSLINNFGADNRLSFASIMGDVAPPKILWNIQKLIKWSYKAQELGKRPPTLTNKARIQYYNSRINNNLPTLIKEVTNARKEGYTITLPAVWENKI